LSKGKVEENEDIKTATRREIKEETGLDIDIEEDLGVNEYIAYHPELGKIKKRVHYFLARATTTEIRLEKEGGLDNAQWFDLQELQGINTYDDIIPLLTKSVSLILDKKSS